MNIGGYPIDDDSWIDVGQWKDYKNAIDSNQLFYEDKDINKISASTYYQDLFFLDQVNKRPWLGSSVENYMLKKIKISSSIDSNKTFKRICNTIKRFL